MEEEQIGVLGMKLESCEQAATEQQGYAQSVLMSAAKAIQRCRR